MQTKRLSKIRVPDDAERQLKEMRHDLLSLASKMSAAEKQFAPVLKKVHPSQRSSAVNLLDYMALRNVDIRNLQENLHINGLSSLSSSEGHVRCQLNAVLKMTGAATSFTRA